VPKKNFLALLDRQCAQRPHRYVSNAFQIKANNLMIYGPLTCRNFKEKTGAGYWATCKLRGGS
jgi:hypothetical protein